MTQLTLANLRAILHTMNKPEIEDMVCALYRSGEDASTFFNNRYNTQEYIDRLLHTYKAYLDVYFCHLCDYENATQLKRYVYEFSHAVSDVASALELMLFCVEKATQYACDEEASYLFLDDLIAIFRDFVQMLSQQSDFVRLFSHFQVRLEQLEWDAGSVGIKYGETISELCLELITCVEE
ncbi:MAG: hypothetical protein RR142_03235 [Clostridia bacterium]